jgi:hypothetical protein
LQHKFKKIIDKFNRTYQEYNLTPTSPRIPTITKRENLHFTDQQIISKYKFFNSIKKTAKYFNVYEKIILSILEINNAKHPKGYKKTLSYREDNIV